MGNSWKEWQPLVHREGVTTLSGEQLEGVATLPHRDQRGVGWENGGLRRLAEWRGMGRSGRARVNVCVCEGGGLDLHGRARILEEVAMFGEKGGQEAEDQSHTYGATDGAKGEKGERW